MYHHIKVNSAQCSLIRCQWQNINEKSSVYLWLNAEAVLRWSWITHIKTYGCYSIFQCQAASIERKQTSLEFLKWKKWKFLVYICFLSSLLWSLLYLYLIFLRNVYHSLWIPENTWHSLSFYGVYYNICYPGSIFNEVWLKKNATCWAKTWNVKNGEYQVNDTKKLSSNVQYLHFHVPFQIIQSLVRADVLRIIIANAKNMKIIAVNRSPWFSCFKPSSNLEFTVLTWFDFYLQLQSYQFQNVTPKMMLRSASQAL